MLFKRKRIVKVRMRELDSEKENLAKFLLSQSKLTSTITSDGLELNMEEVPTYSLARMVTKFLHNKNLSNTYFVDVDNNVVRINRFKHENKVKKNKHPTTPSIMKHGF